MIGSLRIVPKFMHLSSECVTKGSSLDRQSPKKLQKQQSKSELSISSDHKTVSSHSTAQTVLSEASYEDSLPSGNSISTLEKKLRHCKHQVHKETLKVQQEEKKVKILETMIEDLRQAHSDMLEVYKLQIAIQDLQDTRDQLEEEITDFDTETLRFRQMHATEIESLRTMKQTFRERKQPTGYREATIIRYAPLAFATRKSRTASFANFHHALAC